MILAELLKNMQNWTDNLFSEGELADYLIIRWQRFAAALNAARQDGSENRFNMEELFLQTPELLTGTEIVEYNFVEQELLPGASPRYFIILQVPFFGDAELLQNRLPDCPNDAPEGMVCEQYLRLRYEQSGPTDNSWRGDYLSNIMAITDFIDLVDVYVKCFNERIRQMLPTLPQQTF